MVTNKEVFEHGEEINNYPCDLNPITKETESNRGIEHKIKYGNNIYYIITDWSKAIIYEANKEANRSIKK